MFETVDCFVAQHVIDHRINLQSDRIPTIAWNETRQRKRERINHLSREHCQECSVWKRLSREISFYGSKNF